MAKRQLFSLIFLFHAGYKPLFLFVSDCQLPASKPCCTHLLSKTLSVMVSRLREYLDPSAGKCTAVRSERYLPLIFEDCFIKLYNLQRFKNSAFQDFRCWMIQHCKTFDVKWFDVKGAQAWEFFACVFLTEVTHLARWLGDWTKKPFFYHLTPDFERFWFFAAYWGCSKKKKIKLSQNSKLVVVALEPICVPTMCFFI